jgi:hypothetical protein
MVHDEMMIAQEGKGSAYRDFLRGHLIPMQRSANAEVDAFRISVSSEENPTALDSIVSEASTKEDGGVHEDLGPTDFRRRAAKR